MSAIYYYGSAHRLDELIGDVFGDIREVIREVEGLCQREVRASRSYRENPPAYMASGWHPWWSFVVTGNGAYLGWEPDEVPVNVRELAWSEAHVSRPSA